MMKRMLSTLVCAVAGVAAIGVPTAHTADPPPAAGAATTAAGAARGEKGAVKCAPALGLVAGIVTAIEPPQIFIEVKRAGALGSALVGGELAVAVARRTKVFKNGGPARPGTVKIGDRIAVRVLKCRGDELSAEQVKAAIVIDHGPGAAGDARVAAEKVAETEPTAATVAEIGQPVRQGASGRGQGVGGGSQGAGRSARTTDGDGALAENSPPAAGGKPPGQGAAGQGAAARARAQGAGQGAGRAAGQGAGQGAGRGAGQGARPTRAQGAAPAGNGNGRRSAPARAANG